MTVLPLRKTKSKPPPEFYRSHVNQHLIDMKTSSVSNKHIYGSQIPKPKQPFELRMQKKVPIFSQNIF